VNRRLRLLAAALLAGLLAGAAPARAYVLPATSVVKKAAERRATLEVTSVEVTGALELHGAARSRLGALTPSGDAPLAVAARIAVKTAGRARLELQPADLADAQRPFAAVRDERVSGQGGLEATPAATVLVRALAALLATPRGEEGRPLAEALIRRGVKLDDATLGRFNGRLAYVVGGKSADPGPLLYVDKETFMPLRLEVVEGGTRLDVRLLDWASPIGGDWFPRAVEVWDGPTLLLRFTTEKAAANLKLPDAQF
jgi:hypothetical protein